MGRYWRVYRTFFVSSLVRELGFRANFIAKVFQNAMWIGFFVLILLVIYSNTDSVAGWSRSESFVLVATVFLMSAFSQAFFFSLNDIPQQVRQGTLDFVVTKPIDSQFWISSRRFNFDQVGTLLCGVVLVAFGTIGAQAHPDVWQWLAYILLVLASVAIYYAFNLAMMTTGIWLVRVDNLWVLSESVIHISRFPIDIYGPALQRMFIYAVPLAFLSTIPSRQLVHAFDGKMLALGLLWAAVGLLLTRLFWRFALRHYTSASS